MSSGKKASNTGNMWEKLLPPVYQEKFRADGKILRYGTQDMFEETGSGPDGILVRQPQFIDFNGSLSKLDFSFVSKFYEVPPTAYEAKWQQSPGSVSAKYPKAMLDLLICNYEQGIFLYGGPAIDMRAIDGLKSFVEKMRIVGFVIDQSRKKIMNKVIVVFSQDEHLEWVNNGFPPLKDHPQNIMKHIGQDLFV